MMCGIAVVVGQEPLRIHVTPDSDDIPWQNVASMRFSFRAQEFTHGALTRLYPTFGTPPTTSSRNEDVLHRAKCRRDITRFCHPRRFTKGANTLTRILAECLIGEDQRSISGFNQIVRTFNPELSLKSKS